MLSKEDVEYGKGSILSDLDYVARHTGRIPTEFMEWLCDETDFFEAPASSRHRNVFVGGLALHSTNVVRQLGLKCKAYDIKIPHESIIICGYLHDLCKIHTYAFDEKTNRWYKNEKLLMQHSAKSLYLINQFFKLTEQETRMIMYHMGPWEQPTYDKASQRYPDVVAMFTADYEASIFMEEKYEPQISARK